MSEETPQWITDMHPKPPPLLEPLSATEYDRLKAQKDAILARERDYWQEEARRHAVNTDYWRGLVDGVRGVVAAYREGMSDAEALALIIEILDRPSA